MFAELHDDLNHGLDTVEKNIFVWVLFQLNPLLFWHSSHQLWPDQAVSLSAQPWLVSAEITFWITGLGKKKFRGIIPHQVVITRRSNTIDNGLSAKEMAAILKS